MPQQGDFKLLIVLYGFAFGIYAYIFTNEYKFPLRSAIGVAILSRFALIFTFPNLSDDVYRFIWDGHCIHAGVNPYSLLPSEVLSLDLDGNDQSLFSKLNSPDYFTVYPPLSQGIFYIATIGNLGWYGSSIIMKLILFLAEVGSIFLILRLLSSFKMQKQRVLIYALNPLIIIELIGNLHFEALTVFFVLLSLYALTRVKIKLSSVALALGVSCKMLPLMFIPFFWKHTKRNKYYILLFIVALLILFMPILLGLEISNFAQSLDLYFGKFEFNGSVYLILRWIGDWISGYNLIRYLGPGMALITLVVMYRLYIKQESNNMLQLIKACFISITTYYVLSTTIHPWYLALPLMLSLFTQYRFIILWSGLIMLSYINYSFPIYTEIFAVQWIEYSLVAGYLIYEIQYRD